jgi:hypothetical protein
MEFDLLKTAAIAAAVIVVGVGGLLSAGVMATQTVLMMVLPSVVVFAVLMIGLGVKHGEYRASR